MIEGLQSVSLGSVEACWLQTLKVLFAHLQVPEFEWLLLFSSWKEPMWIFIKQPHNWKKHKYRRQEMLKKKKKQAEFKKSKWSVSQWQQTVRNAQATSTVVLNSLCSYLVFKETFHGFCLLGALQTPESIQWFAYIREQIPRNLRGKLPLTYRKLQMEFQESL